MLVLHYGASISYVQGTPVSHHCAISLVRKESMPCHITEPSWR